MRPFAVVNGANVDNFASLDIVNPGTPLMARAALFCPTSLCRPFLTQSNPLGTVSEQCLPSVAELRQGDVMVRDEAGVEDFELATRVD
jgi:hypothetical protein